MGCSTNATGHKGARPHVFFYPPPFLSFLLPPPEAHPLGLSSNCCLQMAMKFLFSTSQLIVPAPPVAHSNTYPEDGRHVQAQQNISTPQNNGLSAEPFSLFFLSQSHPLSLQMHELRSIHISLNANLSWATVLSGNFFSNPTLLARTLAIRSSTTLLFMPSPLRILRESWKNPSHALG